MEHFPLKSSPIKASIVAVVISALLTSILWVAPFSLCIFMTSGATQKILLCGCSLAATAFLALFTRHAYRIEIQMNDGQLNAQDK